MKNQKNYIKYLFFPTNLHRKIYFLFSLLIVSNILNAGNPPFFGFLNSERDTNYIINKSDRFCLRIFTSSKYNQLQLNKTSYEQTLKLYPNDKTSLGIGFSYKWLGLGIGFSFPFMNKDDNIYGETNRFDFQLNTYSKKIGFDTHLQYYKGFYLKNVNNLITWNSPIYPLLPDMETLSMGMNGYYIFNHERFSYRSVFLHNEVQRKSAGSFILGAFWTFNYAISPTHFLSNDIQLSNRYDTIFNLVAYRAFQWGIAIGYAHTFVIWENFFLHMSFVPKLGLYRVTTGTVENGKGIISIADKFGSGLDFRIAFGGEHTHFYWGITGVTTSYNYLAKGWTIKPGIGNAKFFVGKRF